MVGQLSHHRNDAAGIQPRTEERTDGNITDHLRLDGVAKALANLVHQLSLRTWVPSSHGREFQVPVLPHRPSAILECSRVPRGEFVDAAKDSVGIRNPKQS